MINALILSTVAGMSTLIGTLVIFFKIKEKNINKIITFSLSFSLLVMILICITELIPESFFSLLKTYGLVKGQYIAVMAFIAGYFLITIINKFIKEDNLYNLGVLNMLVLIIHNFPEGIATFMTSYTDITLGLKLTLVIITHNIPEGIAIAVPIYYATRSKKKVFLFAFISGLTEPLGALFTFIFLKEFITVSFINLNLIFVGGLMITLAIKDILPKVKSYNLNKYIYAGFLTALIFVIILFFV